MNWTDVLSTSSSMISSTEADDKNDVVRAITEEEYNQTCGRKPADVIRFGIFCGSMVVCILGTLGNSITVAIFSQRKFLSSINVLISGLALFDIFFIIFFQMTVIPFGINYYTGYECDTMIAQGFVLRYIYPMNKISQTMSVVTHLVITFERYLAVCHPFKASRVCTVRFSLISLAVVGFYAVLSNLPRFWEYKITAYAYRNLTLHMPTYDLKADPLYLTLYVVCLDLILNYVIPFGLLVVFNTKIVITLKKATRNRRKYTGGHHQNQSGAADNGMLTPSYRRRSEAAPVSNGGQTRFSTLTDDNDDNCSATNTLISPSRKNGSQRNVMNSWPQSQPVINQQNTEIETADNDDEKATDGSSSLLSLSPSNTVRSCSITRTGGGGGGGGGKRQRRSEKQNDLKQRRTSQMMTLIIMTFLIFHSLSLAISFKDAYFDGLGHIMTTKWVNIWNKLLDLNNFLVLSNSAINFIIYFRYSKVYRLELVKACRFVATYLMTGFGEKAESV